MKKFTERFTIWGNQVQRFVDRMVVSNMKLKTLKGFDDVFNMGVSALTIAEVQRIVALVQYLFEEYDPQILLSRDISRELVFNAPQKNIELSQAELRSLRMILETKETIPPWTRGSWETSVARYFIDEKDRYIPNSQLREYFSELLRFLSIMVEKSVAKDDHADYHLRQLSDLIVSHAQFCLIIKANYEEFLQRK